MGKKKDLCRPSVVFCGIFMVLEGKRDPARVPGTFSGIYFGNICFWDIYGSYIFNSRNVRGPPVVFCGILRKFVSKYINIISTIKKLDKNLRGPPGVWEGAGAPCRLPPSPSWEGSGLSVGGENVKGR